MYSAQITALLKLCLSRVGITASKNPHPCRSNNYKIVLTAAT